MHIPNSRTWQKERKIFCTSDRVDRAKQNLALTTKQLVQQALRNDVPVETHQGFSESFATIDEPNPLRTPTCDLIDYQEYKINLEKALNTAVREHSILESQLRDAKSGDSAPTQAVTSPQQ